MLNSTQPIMALALDDNGHIVVLELSKQLHLTTLFTRKILLTLGFGGNVTIQFNFSCHAGHTSGNEGE